MKNRLLLVFVVLLFSASSWAQLEKQKHRFPVWTFHQRNVTIHGVSLGLASWLPEVPRLTNTNGLKLELIGIGMFFPLIPSSPVSQNQGSFEAEMSWELSEQINGLSISASGTACECRVNGIAAGMVGQYYTIVNGISAAGMMNFAESHNGIQLAFLMNESYQTNGIQIAAFTISHKTKGVQMGMYNQSKNLKGIQIGLWNRNQKRSLPIINWCFKD